MRPVVLVALLAMSASEADAAPPPPRLPAPHKVRVESTLPPMERLDDGSLRHIDPDARFVAVIRPDGQVVMRDLPNLDVEAVIVGNKVVDWTIGMARAITRATHHDRPELETPMPDPENPREKAAAAAERMPPQPYGPAPILIGVKVTFGGLADRLLRKGQRKRTKAKQDFLTATAPLRDAMAQQRARTRQQTALLALGQQLAVLWRNDSRSQAERKRALFDLWDDCDESPPGDDPATTDRARGAEQMRRRIEKFIRQVAPEGSDTAYTASELTRLNAGRVSRQRFDPYSPKDEPDEPDEPSGDPEPDAPRQ